MAKREQLKEYLLAEWDESYHAFLHGDSEAAWNHLERAHILAQSQAFLHVASHFKMLKLAFCQRDGAEIFGQIHRLMLAAPASWLRILPVGNVGSSRVSPFVKMEIPQDLKQLLKELNVVAQNNPDRERL